MTLSFACAQQRVVEPAATRSTLAFVHIECMADIAHPPASRPSRAKAVSRRSVPKLAPKPARGTPKRISLALQGGGSLGAFTWGLLDRLLEEEELTVDANSGASAGAANAVVVAGGLLAGGKPEARRRLDHFWERLSQMA